MSVIFFSGILFLIVVVLIQSLKNGVIGLLYKSDIIYFRSRYNFIVFTFLESTMFVAITEIVFLELTNIHVDFLDIILMNLLGFSTRVDIGDILITILVTSVVFQLILFIAMRQIRQCHQEV